MWTTTFHETQAEQQINFHIAAVDLDIYYQVLFTKFIQNIIQNYHTFRAYWLIMISNDAWH